MNLRTRGRDGFRDCAPNLIQQVDNVITSIFIAGCDDIVCDVHPAPGMIPSPLLLCNRLCWQWEGRHVTAGQVMTLHWWMWQPWRWEPACRDIQHHSRQCQSYPKTCQENSILLAVNTGMKHLLWSETWSTEGDTLQASHTIVVTPVHQARGKFWRKLHLSPVY